MGVGVDHPAALSHAMRMARRSPGAKSKSFVSGCLSGTDSTTPSARTRTRRLVADIASTRIAPRPPTARGDLLVITRSAEALRARFQERPGPVARTTRKHAALRRHG